MRSSLLLCMALILVSCGMFKKQNESIPHETTIRGKIIRVDDHQVSKGGPVIYKIKAKKRIIYLGIPSVGQSECQGVFMGAGRNPEDTIEVHGMLFNNVISICEAPEYYLRTLPPKKKFKLLFWKK